VTLQLRIESLNDVNHWRFNTPDVNPRNAGRVKHSSRTHWPREYLMRLKFLF
jgi:hypothetical protein